MRQLVHLMCAAGLLAVSVAAVVSGCGGDDLNVGGPLPIRSITLGSPVPTRTCVPMGVGCSLTDDNCCPGTDCRSLTLTCG
jgi:hypothetical protein